RDSGEYLHRQEAAGQAIPIPRNLEEVVNPADVGARHAARELHLLPKPENTVRIQRSPGTKCLQGNLTQLRIFGLIDLTHSAAPQEAHDAEAPDHHLAFLEEVLLCGNEILQAN